MKIQIIANGIKNGSTFILSSAIIALWYYFCTQRYPASGSAYLLLSLSTAGIINLLDFGISLKIIHILSTSSSNNRWPIKIVITSSFLGSMMLQATLGSVVYYLILSNSPIPEGSYTYLLVLALALSTQCVQTAISIMKGLFAFNRANSILLASTLFVYAATIPLIIKGVNQESVLAIMSLGQFITAVIAALLIPKTKNKNKESIPALVKGISKCYYQMLRESIEFFPQVFAGTFFLHIQRFFIIELLGEKALANFSFAYALASRLHSVVNSFFDLLFPYAARIVQGRSAIKIANLAGAAAAAICLVGALIVGCIIYYISPEILQPFSLYVLGVLFAMASAPAFHLMNGLNNGYAVSLYSLLAPIIFATILLLNKFSGKQLFENANQVLIPIAYSISMLMVLLLTQHALKKIKT